MRRIVLAFCAIVPACSNDGSPSATDATNADSGSSDAGTTAPMTTADSGSTEPAESSSSSDTQDPTLDPTTESSSTDPTVSPESSTGEPAECGDGMVSGNEACDGDDFAGNSCQSQGFMEGTLVCSSDCLGFSTHNCYVCGDNEIAGTEECDGPLDNSVDCESLGYTEGEVTCDMSTCLLDLGNCSLCGDGVAEGNEFCDQADLFGQDCVSLGFDGGSLGCHTDTCGYDYSGCTGGQYVQDFEGGAIPPEFAFSNTSWVINNSAPINGSYDARNGDIGDNGFSTMTLDVSFSIDGTVDFIHHEDTESCCDFLEFYVDGMLLDSWSGSNGETNASFNISAGLHTFEWNYTKDFSISSGQDSVWIDDLNIFGGVPTG